MIVIWAVMVAEPNPWPNSGAAAIQRRGGSITGDQIRKYPELGLSPSVVVFLGRSGSGKLFARCARRRRPVHVLTSRWRLAGDHGSSRWRRVHILPSVFPQVQWAQQQLQPQHRRLRRVRDHSRPGRASYGLRPHCSWWWPSHWWRRRLRPSPAMYLKMNLQRAVCGKRESRPETQNQVASSSVLLWSPHPCTRVSDS
jgi:hypothetical protein